MFVAVLIFGVLYLEINYEPGLLCSIECPG